MGFFLRRNFRSKFRRATLRRNFIESFEPAEENNAVTIPGTAATVWSVRYVLRRSTGYVNSFQLVIRAANECQIPTVGRPECCEIRIVRSRQRLNGGRIERAQPQDLFAVCVRRAVDNASAIR